MSRAEKISLHDCEALAKEHGFDSSTFDLVGPSGRAKAKWLDAYFGFFTIEGNTGFLRVGDAVKCGLWAENFAGPAPEPKPKKKTRSASGRAQRTNNNEGN